MASSTVKQAIVAAAAAYVKPEGKVFEYGTAGVSYLENGVMVLTFEDVD